MRVLQFTTSLLLATNLIGQSTSLAATNSLTIKGQLLSEQNTPLANAEIRIAGKNVQTTKDGAFSISLPEQKIYKLEIEKSGYYQRIQHFSEQELHKLDDKLSLTLVKKQAKRVMFAFGGDVMMGRRYFEPYFNDSVLIHHETILDDSKVLLQQVKPYLSIADFAALNLESQIAHEKPKERAPKSVTFYSQPEIVEALQWAGIDYVTLGNNHTYDYLDEGLDSTLKALDEKKLPYSGAGFTEEQALKPYNTRLNGTPYAMLSYVGWQGGGKIKQTASKIQGGAAFGSMENIVSSVNKAVKNKHTPIVQYHGSLEYKNEPTGVTEQRLKSAIDNGAAMAIAHHPHVTQGIELYNNKLIAYSMGNFVFDQNFTATQLSYMLYVWMDDGNFHRAEIVPVYLKGYQPVPATDSERTAILKRVTTLSAKRDTHVVIRNGLGVIHAQSTKAPGKQLTQQLNISNEKVHQFSTQLNPLKLNEIQLNDDMLKYRLGTNLVNGHDFEQFNSFDSSERGFLLDRKNSEIVEQGKNSKQSLALNLLENSNQWLGMKTFRRVYNASNPTTIKADIKTAQEVTLKFYWQGRKTRDKYKYALEQREKHLISEVTVPANDNWQPIEIDFNSPRIGYRSYRVLVEVVNNLQQGHSMLIDNFSVVEWQTAFQNNKQPKQFSDQAKMADFIGFNNTSNQAVSVKLSQHD